MYSTMREFRDAIRAARKRVTTLFQPVILTVNNGGTHANWNAEWGDHNSARYQVIVAYHAALDVALAPIAKEWYTLPIVSHDWSGPYELSRWGKAVKLPSGTHVHTDALHHELESRPWPMAALQIAGLIDEDEEEFRRHLVYRIQGGFAPILFSTSVTLAPARYAGSSE